MNEVSLFILDIKMSSISVSDNQAMGGTSIPTAKNTRKSSEVFGLGCKISKDDEQITGSRIPTCQQVLRCLIYHVGDGTSESRSRWEAAKLVKHRSTDGRLLYQMGGCYTSQTQINTCLSEIYSADESNTS